MTNEPTAAPLWQREFPDMTAEELPAIPLTWEDTSWHNDACPTWSASPNVGVAVDFADASKSDFPQWRADGTLRRFVVFALEDGQRWFSTPDEPELGSFDDWNECLAAMMAWELRCNLAELLSADEFADMLKRNATYGEGICASHDFCDANMPMANAFESVVGRPALEAPDGTAEHEADCVLWSRAWTVAKRQHLGGGQ